MQIAIQKTKAPALGLTLSQEDSTAVLPTARDRSNLPKLNGWPLSAGIVRERETHVKPFPRSWPGTGQMENNKSTVPTELSASDAFAHDVATLAGHLEHLRGELGDLVAAETIKRTRLEIGRVVLKHAEATAGLRSRQVV